MGIAICRQVYRTIGAASLWLGLVAGLAAWVAPANAAATEVSARSADKVFAEATALFQEGHAAQALEIFLRLRDVVNSPNVHLYIGYCYVELERPLDAHRAFSIAAKTAADSSEPKYEQTRISAQDQLNLLNLRLARVTISFVREPGNVQVVLDDSPLDQTLIGSPIVVTPGHHRMQATADGMEPVRREIVLSKGDHKTIAVLFEERVDPNREPRAVSAEIPSRSPLRTIGMVAGGIGVAGLAVFTVAGLQARSTYRRLQSECGNQCTDEGHRSTASDGETYQLAANVGLTVGVLGVLSGATLFYLGSTSNDAPSPTVALAPDGGRIAIQGRF